MGAASWSPTKWRGTSFGKKPERQLCTAAVCALCLAAAVVSLARSEFLRSWTPAGVCEGTNCVVSAQLRGAQQLLSHAAHQVSAQHSEAMADGETVQRLQYESHDSGSSSSSTAISIDDGGDAEDGEGLDSAEVLEGDDSGDAADVQKQGTGGAPATNEPATAAVEGSQDSGDSASEGSGEGDGEGQALGSEAEDYEEEEEESLEQQGKEQGSSENDGGDDTESQPAATAGGAAGPTADGGKAGGEPSLAKPEAATQPAAKAEAAEEAGAQRSEQISEGIEAPSAYQLALQECDDLACVSRAGKAAVHPGQYRFPSFFIVGWQKCATTSLFSHLRGHAQVLPASAKEPEFFSNDCDYDPESCPAKEQSKYLHKTLRLEEALQGGLRQAAVEASTHYGRAGVQLAGPISEIFPWLKVVISLREPISRALSMLAHLLDKHESGCLTRADVYQCVDKHLQEERYAPQLEAWLAAYPAGQVYVMQYENLTSDAAQDQVLHDVKSFLGLDPTLPGGGLELRNSREYHLLKKGELQKGEEAEGWRMKRWQYEELVELVRPDSKRVAQLVSEHGLADGDAWLATWEREWAATLDSCGEGGTCIVVPT